MATKEKVTISLPKEVVDALREEIPNRNRSKFIAETIKKQLRKLKEQALIKAYKEAYTEIEKENQKFNGVTGDGIS
ncbi:MAG TPA: hypothetical protein DEG96_02320 [Candidatus Atribacteria bacterium]|nr:hypothetical protein [Candidatus Atribacteria bacterium]